jgi:hypothetical protein
MKILRASKEQYDFYYRIGRVRDSDRLRKSAFKESLNGV